MIKYEKLVVGELKTNCYLIWTDTGMAYIIDPGDDGTEISQRINELKLNPKAILLTHGHFDHLLGAGEIQLIYNIPIYLNNNDEFLLKRTEKTTHYFLKNKTFLSLRKVLFYRNNYIDFGKSKIFIYNTPGHTPGSVCFYIKDTNLLFTGDVIFANGETGETRHQYSSKIDMIKSIDKLLKLPTNTIVLPGHGDDTIMESVKKYI